MAMTIVQPDIDLIGNVGIIKTNCNDINKAIIIKIITVKAAGCFSCARD